MFLEFERVKRTIQHSEFLFKYYFDLSFLDLITSYDPYDLNFEAHKT